MEYVVYFHAHKCSRKQRYVIIILMIIIFMKILKINVNYISFICDKSVTTQNLAFLSYWYRKKRLQMHF
jgi:hypothetical protein